MSLSPISYHVPTSVTAIAYSLVAEVSQEFKGAYSALKNPSELLASYLTPAFVQSGLFNSDSKAIEGTVKDAAGVALDLGASFLLGGVYDVVQMSSIVLSGKDLMTGRTLSTSEKLWSMAPLLLMPVAGVFAFGLGKVASRVLPKLERAAELLKGPARTLEEDAMRLAADIRLAREKGKLICFNMDVSAAESLELAKSGAVHVVSAQSTGLTKVAFDLLDGKFGISTSSHPAIDLLTKLDSQDNKFNLIRLPDCENELPDTIDYLQSFLCPGTGKMALHVEAGRVDEVQELLKGRFPHVVAMPSQASHVVLASYEDLSHFPTLARYF